MNRRSALITIGLTALSGVANSVSRPLRLLEAQVTLDKALPAGRKSKSSVEERLRKDLDRLKPRAYSEEGIPMFLGCEDLAKSKSSHGAAKVTLTAMNAALASELRRNAEAWTQIEPHPQAKDVAPIIEVLADRDFTVGRTVEAR